jgi:hypothetical protein
MVYICYDKIYTVLGIGRAPPGLPGPRAPPAWYQALPEQAQKACLLGALSPIEVNGVPARINDSISLYRICIVELGWSGAV